MINIDLAAQAALWYQQLCDSNNERFVPLFFDEHRYLVLMGGGGSGKSIFAGRKILERAVTEQGHRFLVCRKVAKTLRDSCFRQLVGQLQDYYPMSGYRINQSDMRISFPNGNEILFSGLDDVEKLKSIYNITGIWIEEASEIDEQDLSQLDIRLRGETRWYKQIIISFNPISALHWLKKRFFDKPDERALTHRSTYKDNRFLDDEAKRTLEAFKDTDPYYYAVYCLGEWGVVGQTVFPAQKVAERLSELPVPISVGLMDYDYDGLTVTKWRYVQADDGYITIYSMPEDGVPYVLGGDTSGEGSDYYVAHVIDNRDGRQVATLRRQRLDADEFARQVYCLGRHYNDALVAIEANFDTYPIMELERLGYPNQYVRESIDDYTHRPKRSYGYLTNTRTRPASISNLVQFVRDCIDLINDRATLEEMLTFVRDERGRPAAEDGAHDDCIMALAIAHMARDQQRYDKLVPPAEAAVWEDSMWEDYYNADPNEQEYLISIWGNPFGG